MISYVFDLTPDDNGTYLATCSAFPEFTTSVEHAGVLFFAGLGALEEAIAARMSSGQSIPQPATPAELATIDPRADGEPHEAFVKLPHITNLKVLLLEALRGEGLTRADPQRRLGWKRESIDRLFRLDHNSRAGQIEEALLALGLEIVTTTTSIAPAKRAMRAGRLLKTIRDAGSGDAA